MDNGKCVKTCPEGKYANITVCESCHINCATCDGNLSNNCLSCKNNLGLDYFDFTSK